MAVGDIGVWIDKTGTLDPGTTFTNFPFEGTGSEDRNDGGYTYNSGSDDITITDAGNYLVVYNLHGTLSSNNRTTMSGRVTINGTVVEGSYASGFGRNTTNDHVSLQGFALCEVSASDEIAVEWRRDTDDNITSALSGDSSIMIVRMPDDADATYAHYEFTAGNTLGGTTWTDVPITSTLRETDTAVVERTGDNIRLKPSDTSFLILYAVRGNGGASRTQRETRAVTGSTNIPQSHGYEYCRNGANEYCNPNSMFIHRTTASDEDISIQCRRSLGSSWGIETDGSWDTDVEGGVYVIELPSSAEVFISRDDTAGQSVVTGTTTDVNLMRDVTYNDSAAFIGNGVNGCDSVKTIDALLMANSKSEATVGSGTRNSKGLRFEIEGVDETLGVAYNYLRGDQSTQDCPTMCLQTNTIVALTADDTINVEFFDGGDNGGGTAATIAGGGGFSALNLDSLVATSGTNVTASKQSLVVTEYDPVLTVPTPPEPSVPVLETWNGDVTSTTNTTTLELDKPAGVVSGDFLVIIATNDASVSTTQFADDITGFDLLSQAGDSASDAHIGVYTRMSDGTEDASETITCTTSSTMTGWYLRVSGVDASGSINGSAFGSSAVNSNHDITGVTTTVDACLAIYGYSHDGGDGLPFVVTGTGWSTEDEQTVTNSSSYNSSVFGVKDIDTAGATGTANVTPDTSDGGAWFQLALKGAVLSGDLEVTTTTDSLTLTEQDATVTALSDTNVTTTTQALALTEQDVTVDRVLTVTTTTDSLSITELVTTVSTELTVSATTDSLTLTDLDVTIDIAADLTVSATSQALTLTEQDVTVNRAADLEVTTTTDSLLLTEQDATIGQAADLVVNATSDSLTLAALNAAIGRELHVTTSTDSLSITGQTTAISRANDLNVPLTTASLTLTEQDTAITIDRTIAATSQALLLTELNATVDMSLNVSTTTDSLSITSQNVTLDRSLTVSATTDTLVIDGKDATVSVLDNNIDIDATTDELNITGLLCGVVATNVQHPLIDRNSAKVINTNNGSISVYFNNLDYFTWQNFE